MSPLDLGRFPPEVLEKVSRISDLVERVYLVPFPSRRLAFYGGTCLNFVHMEDAPRLSLDLDFNFRDIQEGDWGEERDMVDDYLKRILEDIGYRVADIKIQATYPLTRFEVWYVTNSGGWDSFKVEIGYQRRLPLLPSDTSITWHHPFSGRGIEVLTPVREELFSNKVATLLYRFGYPDHLSGRDLFDVYTISHANFEKRSFMASFVIDSLTRPERRLDDITAELSIDHSVIEGHVEELIADGPPLSELSDAVSGFLKGLLDEVRRDWKKLIDDFFLRHRFHPEGTVPADILNVRIEDHPGILWSLERLKKVERI